MKTEGHACSVTNLTVELSGVRRESSAELQLVHRGRKVAKGTPASGWNGANAVYTLVERMVLPLHAYVPRRSGKS